LGRRFGCRNVCVMKNLLRGLMFCFAVFACCTALALVICGACGHEVADEQRFCGHCGARVGDDKPAAEDVAATAETVPSPVDLQTVLDAAREDSRMAAEIEEGLPEVALCYYRNAAALARLLPDGMLPDDSGKRLAEAVERCQRRLANTRKPCSVCGGTGRRTVQLRALAGGSEGALRGVESRTVQMSTSVVGSKNSLTGAGVLCTACGGTGLTQSGRNADEMRLMLAQGLRNHETRQQAARRVAIGNVWAPLPVAEALTPRLQALLRTAAASPCADCQGLGIQMCGSCKGQGRTVCKHAGCKDGMIQKRQSNSLTPATALMIKTTCPSCNGSGLIACVNCGGKGHVLCRTCGGLGQPKKCVKCGGAGTGPCKLCKGTGKDRSGMLCSACGGEGVGLCPTCHGEGCAGQ